jgi:pimeloyl-ACP methyl ester carboxylesterase
LSEEFPRSGNENVPLRDQPGTLRLRVHGLQIYPEWNAYLKDRQPKTLVVWGRNDSIFAASAPEIVKRNVPAAQVSYFDGCHFVLDEYADEIAEAIIINFSR